jgi:uncharacterized protein (DUF2147 family)
VKFFFILSFLFATGNFFSQSYEADKIVGTWQTGTGRVHIKITKYSDKYGGKIVWMKVPNKPDGSPKLDEKNPDKSKNSNPVLGMNNLLGFKYAGNKLYEEGTIYDPNNGKTYKCTLTLQNDSTLVARGYVGIQMLGRSDTWKRVTQ